jgi:hypothetical protein
MKKIFGLAAKVSDALNGIINTAKRCHAVCNCGVRSKIPVHSEDSGGSGPPSLPTLRMVTASNSLVLIK